MVRSAPLNTAPDNSAEPAISALSPLRFPVFKAVWFASILSNLGGLIQSVGAAWLMTSIAESADMVALVQASVTLPIMLLSVIAGALADSVDRRKIMLGSQIFLLVVSVTLSLCSWQAVITPWLLLLFTFLIGCGNAFMAPAWQASVGDMVPRAHLPGAVTLNSMGFNMARSVGPAIGGVIVAALGAATAFAVNAFSYIGLITVLFRWRPPTTPRLLPPETLGAAAAAGIRYVSMSPAIRTVLGRSALFGVGSISILALLPLVAKILIAGGPLTYGLLLGAFGIGAIAGAVGSARLRQSMSTEVLVRWASLGFAVSAAVTGISHHLLLTMAMLLIAGAGWVLALSTFNVAVQLSAPRWVVGRALSLYQMATFGGMAFGSWLWGAVVAAENLTVSLLMSAVVSLLCAALGRWLPLAQAEELDLEPLRSWREPVTAVPVDSRSGPIVIIIEYIIDEADIVEFLHVMAERRRIRRRDGAFNWTLSRDLADPRLWIERYHTPTWLDYVRHNSRMTQEDAVVPERLRALHRGDHPPVVRRLIERQTDSLPGGALTDTHHHLSEALTDPTQSS